MLLFDVSRLRWTTQKANTKNEANIEKRFWKKWNLHHARILSASRSASWKKWALEPYKKGVFCNNEHHAAEIDAQSLD